MPTIRGSVKQSSVVKARVGQQNVSRVLSNASSTPTRLIDSNDVNSQLRTEDGLILVWDLPTQTFIMTSVIDSASSTIGGIAYYTNTTDNILGDSNTGSVQIDGGVGINKNLTVGGGFYVQGPSEFIGVTTLRGGTINIGGEFISNLTPNDDNSYDLGSETKRWRNGFFSNTLSTNSLFISGISTFNGFVDINDSVFVSGITSTNNLFVSGTTTFLNDLSSLNVVGFVSVTEGLYYDADDYDGPNGVAYFDNSGKLVSGLSTESSVSTSNYILTTLEIAGIGTPVWTSTIDGGEY